MRSKAAAQLLRAENFPHIYNVNGGIIAYKGGKAVGDETFGMEFFIRGNFNDVFRMSYAMEDGLQQLYITLEKLCNDDNIKVLLTRLARFEGGHKIKLKARFPHISNNGQTGADSLEGGFTQQQMLAHFKTTDITPEDILQLGITIETQAYDLYSRLAAKSDDTETKEFFLFMVNEEKQHLKFLNTEYNKILSKKNIGNQQ